MDGQSDHYTWDGRLLDEPENEWPVPPAVPTLSLTPLRPAVANALEVLHEAIRDEMSLPKTATESDRLRALGWHLFARDAFHTLFTDQIADEITVEYLKADTDG